MKSAAQLIVHPALGHFAQGQQHHIQRFFAVGVRVIAQQEIEDAGPRKLGRSAESTQARNRSRVETRRRRSPARPAGLRCYRCPLRKHRSTASIARAPARRTAPRGRDPAARPAPGSARTRPESGTAVAIVGRKISAAEERLALRRQPHRHGPSAAAGRGLHEQHVDPIHVRALFAIHFYRHEVSVQDAARCPRSQKIRAPSRGTSGRWNSRRRERPACPRGRPFQRPLRPRDTSPPDCARAATGTDFFRLRDGFAFWWALQEECNSSSRTERVQWAHWNVHAKHEPVSLCILLRFGGSRTDGHHHRERWIRAASVAVNPVTNKIYVAERGQRQRDGDRRGHQHHQPP